MKTFIYNLLNAGNDVSGNPRRCFEVWDNEGRYMGAVDEGYAGESAMHEQFGRHNFIKLGHYEVKVSDYKRTLKNGQEWIAEQEEQG